MNDVDYRMDDFNSRLKLLEKSSINQQRREVVHKHNNHNPMNSFNNDLRFWFLQNFLVCVSYACNHFISFSISACPLFLCSPFLSFFFFAPPVQCWIFVYWTFNTCGKKQANNPCISSLWATPGATMRARNLHILLSSVFLLFLSHVFFCY